MKLEVIFQVVLQKTLEYLCQRLLDDKCYRASLSVPNTKFIFCDAVVVYTELYSQNAAKGRLSTHVPKWILNYVCLKQKQMITEIMCLNSTDLASQRRKGKKIVARSPWKVGKQGKKIKALHALAGTSSYCSAVLRRQQPSNNRSLESSAVIHSDLHCSSLCTAA